jgi:hypothetical protein
MRPVSFQAVYESPFHIPVAAWAGCAAAVVIAIRRRRMVGFVFFFAIVCALDAWLTGPWTPLAQDSAGSTAAGVSFVIAGDLRWFAVLERAARRGWSIAGWLVALGLSFIVPVLAQIARAAGLSEMRKIFLVYELAFFALALVMHYAILPRRLPAIGAWRNFARDMTRIEIVQYGLWACADILLLTTQSDEAWLVRMVPNLTYYAFFLVAIAALAPRQDE